MHFEIAQLNVATMKGTYESVVMLEFVANLDRINALAESSPGFRWRLLSDEGNATEFRPLGDLTLINLSVWENLETLKSFVCRTAHAEIMKRRGQWLNRMREANLVLWWVPKDHRPSLAEAIARLEQLRSQGPSPAAFDFGSPFPITAAAAPRTDT